MSATAAVPLTSRHDGHASTEEDPHLREGAGVLWRAELVSSRHPRLVPGLGSDRKGT